MKSRAAALALVASVSLPAVALAEEVRADLGGTMVPVGVEGSSVVRVERSTVAGTRYAIVRTREPAGSSRCALPAERVSAWTQVDGRWVESLNEVFDRCPADRRPDIALVMRARVVLLSEGPASGVELHVRMLDPRMRASTAPITRFRRVGDRFVSPRDSGPLAAGPGAPADTLGAVAGLIDGRGDEWQGRAPFAELRGSGEQRAQVWLGAQGSSLRFAARVEGASESSTLTLRLAEPGVSTARIRGRAGNAGRTLTVRCAGDASPAVADATVRCARQGTALFIEGETELASMLWSRDEVSAVAAHASVSWGESAAESAPRLRAVALPSAFSVMEGASAEARAACAGGLRGRVSETAGVGAMPGMITCGARCEDGLCERTLGSFGAATRVVWEPSASAGLCMNVTGAGAEDFMACSGEGADHVRLVGQIPARGFDLVVAVERTLHADGARRPELWTLVTRSARWQRVWTGAAVSAESPRLSRVTMHGQHPALCRGADDARCEEVAGLAFMPAAERGAMASLRPSRD